MAEQPPFGKELLSCPYVIFVLWLFVILVISCVGFEGEIWVLIVAVPGQFSFISHFDFKEYTCSWS